MRTARRRFQAHVGTWSPMIDTTETMPAVTVVGHRCHRASAYSPTITGISPNYLTG